MDVLNSEAEKITLMSEEKSNTLEVEPFRPRSDSRSSERTLFNMSDADADEKRSTDIEKEGVEGKLPTVVTKDHVTTDPLARAKLLMWMAVNTVATVLIVSCVLLNRPSTVLNGFSVLRRSRLNANRPLLARSFATKPYSATNPSNNVKPPSQPFISSSQRQRSTSSPALASPCSTPRGSQS